MKPFREALAEIVRERGLQQMDVAVRGRVSEATITRYLHGTRRPQPGTIARIAVGLGLPPEYFKEYRYWRAHRMIEVALDDDVIELADLENFLKVSRAAREAGA
jgi:transcriptional regulator with XRE-family HTH domain